MEERPAKEPAPRPVKPEPKPAPCPYCGFTLEPRPRRKKKCPHCGEPIFVRQGNLLTQEQAEVGDWLNRVEYLGVTRKDFDRNRQELAKQFGFTPSVNDTIWRVLNSLIVPGRSHQELRFVYQEMADLVWKEGKDPKPYQAEAAKHELLEMKEGFDIFENVRVTTTTCNDDLVCPACREFAKRTFTIDEALATLPVPNGCQSEERCRCTYVIADDNEWS